MCVSVHADYQEILGWIKNFNLPSKEVFLTHGELLLQTHFVKKLKKSINENVRSLNILKT
ncbi:MAG: hypothetical protein K2W94_02375 [Alphaproteobacteria bacterium]|nr:hypothetical protein [Alphaproteobacteria bacterium]